MIKLAAKQNKEADEAFRQVLKIDPAYQLDVDYYSPSTRSAFDKVRQEMATEKKVTLQVRSNPAGADVFLDGFNVGKTPLNKQLPPTRYQLVLMKGGITSFARAINVSETPSVHVDLDFEGAVKSGPPLCISEGTRADKVGNAVKMGALLGVDEVALVRISKQEASAQWVTASLINVRGGSVAREGGLKMDPSGPPSQVDDLVAYTATGQPTPNLVVAQGKQPAPWNQDGSSPSSSSQTPGQTSSSTGTAGTGSTSSSTPTASTTTEPVEVRRQEPRGPLFPPGSLRPKAWIPAAAGGALVVTGAIFYGIARTTEAALRNRDPGITDPAATAAAGQRNEAIGVTLGITGLVAAGAAGAMYLLDATPPATSVSVIATPQGGAAVLSGTF
jgi:hypothetical protein